MPNFDFLTGKSATQGLWHFENVYTDSSYFGRTLSHANSSFNSTTKKFGSYSLLLTTAGAAYAAGFASPTNQLTIEFWISCSDPGAGTYSILYESLVGSGGQGFVICYDQSNAILYYDCITSAGTYSGNAVVLPYGGTFHHIAIVQVSSTQIIGFYDGGVLSVPIPTISGTIATPTVTGFGESYTYTAHTNTFNQTLAGYYDEWRISSTARWTSAFTPPTAAYVY
jgi:Concanavalin A-like lectin/glucanases superfamily